MSACVMAGCAARAAAGARIRIGPGRAGRVDGDLLKGGCLNEDISAEKADFLALLPRPPAPPSRAPGLRPGWLRQE